MRNWWQRWRDRAVLKRWHRERHAAFLFFGAYRPARPDSSCLLCDEDERRRRRLDDLLRRRRTHEDERLRLALERLKDD